MFVNYCIIYFWIKYVFVPSSFCQIWN